jgi:AcrR family transcriptional regulator
MMKPDEKKMSAKRAATRQRLVEAAAEAIGEKGFHAVTLDQIAARAGLTKGAVYDNFPSKEALFLAVVNARRNFMPMPELPKSAPLQDRIRAYAAAIVADGEARKGQAPIRAEFLLYSLSRPELLEGVAEWTRRGFAWEEQRLLAVFDRKELPMAPDRFILLMEAMLPGLNFIKAQTPEIVTDEAVLDILRGLLGKR